MWKQEHRQPLADIEKEPKRYPTDLTGAECLAAGHAITPLTIETRRLFSWWATTTAQVGKRSSNRGFKAAPDRSVEASGE